jgi:hypothetical protein
MPNDAESVRIRETVVLELAVLRDLLRSVTLTPADPPLPGTDVPVRRIAALIRPLARGRLDLSDAEAAFPALSRDQILRAFRHSRARPERDREQTADRLVTALGQDRTNVAIRQVWSGSYEALIFVVFAHFGARPDGTPNGCGADEHAVPGIGNDGSECRTEFGVPASHQWKT